MINVEAFANQYADSSMTPLHVDQGAKPVLATPAYGAYVTAVFTAGIISDAVESHHAAEVNPLGAVPNNGSVDQLLSMRVDGVN